MSPGDKRSSNLKKLGFRSPIVLTAIGVAATLVLALVVVLALWGTGGAETVSRNAGLIGALVALGGVFTAQMVSIALDDRRSQEARELEEDRARETALRSYLDTIGDLLAEEKLQLPQREEASNKKKVAEGARTVARAQTLTVLQGLNRERKRIVVQFLYEAKLIISREDGPVISLIGADLSGADLREIYLEGADLFRTNLRGADLWKADLGGATLCEADLQGAYLKEASLRDVDLAGADLRDVHDLDKKQVEAAHINEATKLSPT
jgi:hypothetical protein